LLAIGSGAMLWWRLNVSPPAPVAVSAGEDASLQHLGDRYAGMQACAECHAERVAEFQATRHCLACCKPDPKSMPAAFGSKSAAYAARQPNVRFEMTRSGDEFFETTIVGTPQGEERSTARIDLVYGAGAGTDEVYLSWKGEALYELPIAWLHPEQCWGASAFLPLGEGSFARELTPRCLDCHNTWFEHAPGTLNVYKREPAILGVTCEKCHGPGADHVAFHQARRRSSSGGEAIVNPARLSRERQIDLCAQCHSNAILYRGPAFSYVPGEPLDAHFRTIGTRHPEDDHVANQVSYLRESKCFQASETMTCTTCHDPHRPKPTGPEAAQSACLKCHEPANCGARTRLPAPVQDNCVGCHMPVSKKVQVFFWTEHEDFSSPVNRWEHRIGVYPAAELEVLLAWHRSQNDERDRVEADRLAAALNEHWLSEGDRFRQEHRFLPAIYAYRQALELSRSPTTQAKLDEALKLRLEFTDELADAGRLFARNQFPAAIQKFERVLEIDPHYSKAHGKLGAAYAAIGKKELAEKHLRASIECDPDNPYGPGMLGWLAYLAGKPEESLKHYLRAEEIDPYNAQVNYQLGLALSSLNRWPEAEQRFRKALAIDPNHAGASQGLSHALRQKGDFEESLRFALRAAKLTQFENLDILITLADSYASADRPLEAGKAAAKALAASQAGKSRLAPENRLRLELLQDRARRAAKRQS
jgi:predicted CXXCH cytochrome family protein